MRGARLAGLTAALIAAAGCADPAKAPSSGFLGDYSQLRPGRGDQAQLVYVDVEADFSGYTKILVDRPVVWHGRDGAASQVNPEELARMADYLGEALRAQLASEFEVVERPESGTLQIRSAITGATESSISVEVEVLDALSQRRLIAAVDTRGSIRERDWGDVRKTLDFWAGRVRERLAAFRRFDATESAFEANGEP